VIENKESGIVLIATFLGGGWSEFFRLGRVFAGTVRLSRDSRCLRWRN